MPLIKQIFILLASLMLFSNAIADYDQWVYDKYTFSPSYDCEVGGLKNVEKIICNDPKLSIKDYRLSQIYAQALEKSQNSPLIKSQQRAWIKDVRNKCNTKECLYSAYEKREVYLGEIAIKDGSLVVNSEFSGKLERKVGIRGSSNEEETLVKQMSHILGDKKSSLFFCNYVWSNKAGSMNLGYGGLCWAEIDGKIDQYFMCFNMASSHVEPASISSEYLVARFLEINCYGG